MTTARSFVGLVHGTKVSVSPALPYPTKSTYPTTVYSRTFLSFGSIEAGNHAAANCHHLRPQFRKPLTTAVLALGRHHLKHSLITPTALAPSHPQFNLAQKLPVAQPAETHRSAFAGTCFNVTASLVARAAQVRRSRPESSFMSTTLSLGARAARPRWKTCKHFARYAISGSRMCIRANTTVEARLRRWDAVPAGPARRPSPSR